MHLRLLLTALIVVCLGTTQAHADNPMLGSWTIVKAEVAPWSDEKSDKPDRAAVPEYIGKRVTFTAGRIDGPRFLACDKPVYEMNDFPAAGLFQGGLGTFEDSGGKKAEDTATALGFARRPIKTLMTGCEHSIDYHMADANNAAFALDNMIYWLKRDGTP
jgi:hypothetical protein